MDPLGGRGRAPSSGSAIYGCLLDVREGPGLIAIVWPEGSEPRVTAFGVAGEELDYLDPALFGDG